MKKLLALLLAMLMILSVLAACKSDSDDDDDDDDDKKSYSKKDNGDNDDPDFDADLCKHEFDEDGWYTTVYPTCSEEGVKEATCNKCNEVYEEKIEKEPHCAGETEVKTDGYKYTYCSVCGEEMEKVEAPRDYESEFKTDEAGYYTDEAYIAGNNYTVIKNDIGAIVYTFEDGEELVTYSNGYFVSEKEDIVYLKSYDGTEITNTVSLGVTDFGRNELADYIADGYLFAYSAEEAFSGTTYKAGIVKTDGTWLVPLSTENPILTCGVEVTADWLHDDIAYAGDGNAYFYVGSAICEYYYLVYNFANNKIIKYNTDILDKWDLDDVVEYIDYKDGTHRWYYNGNVYDLKDDGTITHTVIFPEGVSKYTNDNDQYYVNSDGTIFFMANKDDNIVLMNSKGTVVKDFKAAYNATVTSAHHCGDGKWTLWIKNNEGTYYYSAVDITGNFKFDPIKCTDVDSIRIMADDISRVNSDRTIVIDFETGEELYRTASSYSDLEVRDGIFYDDSAEESYFIPGEEAEEEGTEEE